MNIVITLELFFPFYSVCDAWLFSVGGLTSSVNSSNERDPYCKLKRCNSIVSVPYVTVFLMEWKCGGNIRSVIPFDVLYCTRATMRSEKRVQFSDANC